MNTNKLVYTIQDSNLSIHDRTQAAAMLWERMNRYQKTLKDFKSELIKMSEKEDCDFNITSTNGTYTTFIEKQPPTPKIDTLDPDFLRESLGEDFFNQYIAHSHTIRWSEFRNASDDVKKAFYSIPGLEMTQTYQVKFKRTNKLD